VYKEDYICKSASAQICLDDDEEEDGTKQSEDNNNNVKQADDNNNDDEKTSNNEGQKGEKSDTDSSVHSSDGDKKPRAIGQKKEGSRVSKVNFY
jgi:hypothetical protein